MTHITKLPQNLCYRPTNDVKENGKPVMVLDISKTYIEVIPEHLKGVDRIIAQRGQVKYVAPDYQGEIFVFDSLLGRNVIQHTSLTPLSLKNIEILKGEYKDRKTISQTIFDQSYKASMICSGYPDEEVVLPAKLSFFWNPQEQIGILNAGRTWLTEMPSILNISQVIMPNAEKLQRRMKHESLMLRRKQWTNQRRDFGFIRHLTGELIK